MAQATQLPPCGLYRTTVDIAGIPAQRLVYFHNHGDPGAGLYLPEEWKHNRARFGRSGYTLSDVAQAHTLEPLAAEGLYRVVTPFPCCAKQCRTFAGSQLLQLGYNANGRAIVFVPIFGETGVVLPERGHLVDDAVLDNLEQLKIERPRVQGGGPAGADEDGSMH